MKQQRESGKHLDTFNKHIQFNPRPITVSIPSCSRIDSAVAVGGYPTRYLDQLRERDLRMQYDG